MPPTKTPNSQSQTPTGPILLPHPHLMPSSSLKVGMTNVVLGNTNPQSLGWIFHRPLRSTYPEWTAGLHIPHRGNAESQEIGQPSVNAERQDATLLCICFVRKLKRKFEETKYRGWNRLLAWISS
ncbi:uncharacterized protein BDR25DRAFT_359610 [Lindgomyces ingoldianus]|uniref:Uncharacterized protein n=1 Tax=Lindgomyces ingoldianus TaxID=673940 RepID=A0ACB6QGU5_9PLEO|nr:uncharacterized protein BDR25DRAFT_359610 [Lindgomyces ingoldianus]KAF2466244.1 hypothetical protein BDR25DRAFT_359610 [Lindgomyces ingoldianus]